MREQILQFLNTVDATLADETPSGSQVDLYLIGRAALILFYGVHQGAVTRDVDFVLFTSPPDSLIEQMLARFGKGTQLAYLHGLYLEPVLSALPPMPHGYRSRSRPHREATWKVLTIHQLEIHDLAVSKLKRFAAKDREDLLDLCDRGLLTASNLTFALETAFAWTTEKDGDSDRDNAFGHLRRVVAYLEGEAGSL